MLVCTGCKMHPVQCRFWLDDLICEKEVDEELSRRR
mgnify:CR=1 FL=1